MRGDIDHRPAPPPQTASPGNSSENTRNSTYRTFLAPSNFTGPPCFDPNISFRIVWANQGLVLTSPSLLKTLIFRHFSYHQSISLIFRGNVKQVSCVKLLISWFCVSSVFHTLFRSQNDSRKLSKLLIGILMTELTSLNQMSTFSRNLNHHWKCREPKKIFRSKTKHDI